MTNPGGTQSLKTPQGEYLIMDPAAKLEKGCTVAVFLAGDFMLVGRIDRRPVPHRRLVIRWRNAQGEDCLLYTSPSPRDGLLSRMPSSA